MKLVRDSVRPHGRRAALEGSRFGLGIAASVLGAAALPASVAKAAPVITITNQGASHDNVGDTTSGFTSYLLTATADTGDSIGGFDLSTGANGIYGALLQDWTPGKSGATPTPIETDQNGGAFGIDSHILIPVANTTVAVSVSEDNNLVHPTGAPANDTFDQYGTGTAIHGAFSLIQSAQSPSVAFAYLIIPTNSVATYSITVSELVTGSNGNATSFSLSGTVPAASVPEPMSAGIAALATSGLLMRRRRRAVTVLR